MMNAQLLAEAADTLEELAAGLPPPDRLQALASAFALDSLSLETAVGLSSPVLRELSDAARGLYQIASGEAWEIDAGGQRAVAKLACVVREFVSRLACSSSLMH